MESHFENIRPEELADVARVLKRILERYGQLREDPPFNYVLHTAPFNQSNLPWYSWHIEILPRVTNVAGFEWGSGLFINSVFPEDAAKILRQTDA
jgi:UDPglucose--hexose-1-phosphate uridylyltransferase